MVFYKKYIFSCFRSLSFILLPPVGEKPPIFPEAVITLWHGISSGILFFAKAFPAALAAFFAFIFKANCEYVMVWAGGICRQAFSMRLLKSVVCFVINGTLSLKSGDLPAK